MQGYSRLAGYAYYLGTAQGCHETRFNLEHISKDISIHSDEAADIFGTVISTYKEYLRIDDEADAPDMTITTINDWRQSRGFALCGVQAYFHQRNILLTLNFNYD